MSEDFRIGYSRVLKPFKVKMLIENKQGILVSDDWLNGVHLGSVLQLPSKPVSDEPVKVDSQLGLW